MTSRPSFQRSAATLPTWTAVLIYVALLLVAQSFLSRLGAALNLPAPDLFLLTGVLLAYRLRPGVALVAAYAVGLCQDMLGAGVLGLHAAAVAGGTLLVLLSRRMTDAPPLIQTALNVAAAIIGQWLAFMLLTYWLRTGLVTPDALLRTLPLSFLTTLIVAPLWDWLSGLLFGKTDQGGRL